MVWKQKYTHKSETSLLLQLTVMWHDWILKDLSLYVIVSYVNVAGFK